MISTHAIFKKLVKNGMSEKLAETMTEVMEERQDSLVTKSDLRVELFELKGDIKKIQLNQDWLKYIGVACLMLLLKIAFFNN